MDILVKAKLNFEFQAAISHQHVCGSSGLSADILLNQTYSSAISKAPC